MGHFKAAVGGKFHKFLSHDLIHQKMQNQRVPHPERRRNRLRDPILFPDPHQRGMGSGADHRMVRQRGRGSAYRRDNRGGSPGI